MKSLQLHKPVFSYADMVELADTPDLGSGALRRTGSSPAIRTSRNPRAQIAFGDFLFYRSKDVCVLTMSYNLLLHNKKSHQKAALFTVYIIIS